MLPSGLEEDDWKGKRAIGWDKTSLIRKAKQRIHSWFPMGRNIFSHSQESKAPPHVVVTLGDKLHAKCPLPFIPGLYAKNITLQSGISVGQLGLTVPAPSSPSSLCIPSLLAGEVVQEAEKAFMLCQLCSAITKISLSYQHCFHCKPKNAAPYCEEIKTCCSKNQDADKHFQLQNLFFFINVCLCLQKGKPLVNQNRWVKKHMWSNFQSHERSGWSMVHT